MATPGRKSQGDQGLIGQVIDGRYEIQSYLGAGGMGAVYRARQAQLDRIVAIKIPHASTLSNPSWRARFEREGQAMARFSHENIVQVFDFNIKGDRPYIVLEFVQGQELADFLSRPERLSMMSLGHVLRQIARGLDYAHQFNVIHRDIKPENIVIADLRRRVKIMDFGLARFEDMTSEVTRAGFVVGTPHYMAPEQVRGKEVSAASDIYAYTVILYCIFTGRLPFEGEGHTIMMKHASEQPPDPLSINPFLPKPLGRALERSLSKNPEQRHETATALVEDLLKSLGPMLKLSYAAVLRGDAGTEAPPVDYWLDEDPGLLDSTGNIPPEVIRAAVAKASGQPVSTTGSVPPPGPPQLVLAAATGMVAKRLEKGLQDMNVSARIMGNGMQALEQILRKPPALLILTEDLEGLPGSSILRLLAGHPLGAHLPIVYYGDQSRTISRGSMGLGNVQYLTSTPGNLSDLGLQTIQDTTKAVLHAIGGKPTAMLPAGAGLKEGASPWQDLLVQVDKSLAREEVAQLLHRVTLRGEDVPAIFNQLGEILKPYLLFTHMFCAIMPEQMGEQGVLLIDMNDPRDAMLTGNIVNPLKAQLKTASRNHKDFPNDFLTHFTKAWIPADAGLQESTLTMGGQALAIPIEEGPRLFGVFGVTYVGSAPDENASRTIKELAPLAFDALSSSYRRRLLNFLRDFDETSRLWRRRRILEYFTLSIKSGAAQDDPCALLILDIDKLDSFNESLGMEGGDQILSKVGKVIAEQCTGLIRAGRIGNDEFVVVLPKTGSGEALKFGRNLLKLIAAITIDGIQLPVPVTASAGMSFRANEVKSPSVLMRAARHALVGAKAAGPGNIRASM